MNRWLSTALIVVSAALAVPAAAQDYPTKPIRLTVQYAAGGGADFIARLIAQDLPEAIGQPVIVDNRPGANGAIANQAVAAAPPDGYTLLIGAAGPMVVNPHIYGKGQVDTMTAFTPITLTVTSPFAVTLNPSVPAKSMAELTALAKAQPGKLNFGTSGNGGAPHLATELYKSMAGVDMVHIPYKGLAPALVDLIAGQVQLVFADVGLVLPYLKSGQLKAIAVTGERRSSVLPDLPTVAEAGLPGYVAGTWYGLYGPAGLPAPIVEKLNAAARKVLALAAVKERLAAQGLEAADLSAPQFVSFQHSEYEKWGKVVKDAAIKPE